MILQKEIINHAEREFVDKSVIDKDWVLGHVLHSIFEHPNLKNKLVFKGGTCLKKCYFPGYRFSEDLDFTLLERAFVINNTIIEEVIDNAHKNSGISFFVEKLNETQSEDIKQGYEVIVKYWGADHKPNQTVLPKERWVTYIKLDISFTEEVIFPINSCNLIHPYSDKELIGEQKIACYRIEEMFSEKLRSVLQRNRPRDFYDLSFLKNSSEYDIEQVKAGFKRKSGYKNIDYRLLSNLLDDKKIRLLTRHWDASLKHQIAENKFTNPEFLLKELSGFFKTLINN